jgi:hypothetical protein
VSPSVDELEHERQPADWSGAGGRDRAARLSGNRGRRQRRRQRDDLSEARVGIEFGPHTPADGGDIRTCGPIYGKITL